MAAKRKFVKVVKFQKGWQVRQVMGPSEWKSWGWYLRKSDAQEKARDVNARLTREYSIRTNPKMRKAPKGWIAAKAVRVVKRGGKTIVEVKR